MSEDLPTEVYVGIKRGQWPLHIFEYEAHAMAWLRARDVNYPKRLWKAKLTAEYELQCVEPEAYLAPVKNDNAT